MNRKLFLAAFSQLLFSAMLFAQVENSAAERLLQKSGTLAQIPALTAQFRANFEQGLNEQREAPMIPAEKKKLADTAESTLSPKKLEGMIVTAVAKSLNKEHAEALDQWFDSALSKQLLAAETTAAKAVDQRAWVQAGSGLLQNMPEARVEALKSLVNATRVADFVADLSINMAVSAAHTASVATAMATQKKPSLDIEPLRSAAMRDREQVAKSMSEVLLLAYAKTYEKATDAEIKSYVTHLQSPAGAKFADAVIAAFNQTLIAGAVELANGFANPPKPASPRR